MIVSFQVGLVVSGRGRKKVADTALIPLVVCSGIRYLGSMETRTGVTEMTKAFVKNQEVTYIANWNGAGAYFFKHAVVYSCGNKQMILTDAGNGREMGRQFHPGADRKWDAQTLPRMTDAEAEALCIARGAEFIAAEIARMEALMNGPYAAAYADQTGNIAKLRAATPSAVNRTGTTL